ncbi:KTSC domain-containing protein [[Luteovulum] sphaeroides subsp. megalophilum]|uniref:KTSC domain-containing protein n=1 Tax=Cereibacter sphaeroides TaxID=1063 RepID=UPI000B64C47A|nr:KTSC domain-containing protein [Cereibacter sphaeroides]SNT35760.1 KTSC domain-containing protein [[Luteovulum] sphaeroides subsp. megalophilum]
MDRQSVASSNLAEVGYDSDLETLEVQFKSGGIYQYFNVPAFMYERLMSADSLGRFFNAEIKGHYPEAKV